MTKSGTSDSSTPATTENGPDWFVYILLCADNTLYTGVTTDPERRLAEHNDNSRGARYTRTRRPVSLAWLEAAPSRSAACRREAAIKKLSRAQKQALLSTSD